MDPMNYYISSKSPLSFDYIDIDNVPEQFKQAVIKNKQVAEEALYRCKDVRFSMPPSMTGDISLTDKGVDDSDKGIKLENLFKTPNVDELEAVARNPDGSLKRLNAIQLKQIRSRGQFEVGSELFPGQTHTWRLSAFIQKGTERTHRTWLEDLASAAQWLVRYARGRLFGHPERRTCFSLVNLPRSISSAVWLALDLAFGMPSHAVFDLQSRMDAQRFQFVFGELTFTPDTEPMARVFCTYVIEMLRTYNPNRSLDLKKNPLPQIPLNFQSPDNAIIDLRLLAPDIRSRCEKELSRILKVESKAVDEWFPDLKEAQIERLKGEGSMTDVEVSQRVAKLAQEEFLRRVRLRVQAAGEPFDEQKAPGEKLSEEETRGRLHAIAPGLHESLLALLDVHLALREHLSSLQETLHEERELFRNRLTKQYPVRSLIDDWLNEQVECFELKFMRDHRFTLYTSVLRAITGLRERSATGAPFFAQCEYLLRRELTYIRDEEPARVKQVLSDCRRPRRVFKFVRRIWLPGNYQVFRHEYREGVEAIERVRTEFSREKHDHASTRLNDDENSMIPTYSMETKSFFKSSTGFFGWRIVNLFSRFITWTSNSMFALVVLIPFYSPLSYRALLWTTSFTSSWNCCRQDGKVYPASEGKVNSLWSRLASLWRHIARARRNFEETPDRGFLSKDATRWLNCIWNYVLKGVVGSVGLIVFYVVACLLVSTCSLLLGLAAPLWQLPLALLHHLWLVLFYDRDRPYFGSNKLCARTKFFPLGRLIVVRLLYGCVLEPIGSVVTGIAVCPLVSLLLLAKGILRLCIRHTWDAFIFHAIIKPRARVPASDSWIARRTSGPGVASSFYFQISTEQVLLALEGSLEADELDNWKDLLKKRLEMPREAYAEWAKHCLVPFGATLSTSTEYQRLQKFLKRSAREPSSESKSDDESPPRLEWINEQKQASDLKPGQVRRHRLVLMAERTADGGQQFQVTDWTPEEVATVVSLGGGTNLHLLTTEASQLDELVLKLYNIRSQKLRISNSSLNKVKLSQTQMMDIYARGETILQKFYKTRNFPLLEELWRAEGNSVDEKAAAFWKDKGLKSADWLGLLKWHLASIFSSSFLEPLEDTDKSFRIVLASDTTQHLISIVRNPEPSSTASEASALIRSDLDVVERVEYRAPNQIHVDTPSLDVQLFLPASNSHLVSGWKLESSSSPVKINWGTRCINWKRPRGIDPLAGSLEVNWPLFTDSLYASPVEWLFPAHLTILIWNNAVSKSRRQPGHSKTERAVHYEAPGAQVSVMLPPIDMNAPHAQSILRAAANI